MARYSDGMPLGAVIIMGDVYKKHETDAGYDLYAKKIEKDEDKPIYTIHTGVKLAMPDNIFALLVPRSSLHKKGYILANQVGVIDSDYGGEIIVKLIKLFDSEEDIKEGDRIAQLIFLNKNNTPVAISNEDLSFALDYGERKEGGFGSTGH